MVMRFERGQSFEQWLRSLGRLPTQAELDRIVAPLLDALEMLHAADFLHRDIAPDNIIVRRRRHAGACSTSGRRGERWRR